MEDSYQPPKTIQEMRGMIPAPADRERPYSAASYAAQYGITVEDAQDLIEAWSTHKQIERQIVAMFRADPELKARALMLDAEDEPSDDAKLIADRLLSRLGMQPLYGGKE